MFLKCEAVAVPIVAVLTACCLLVCGGSVFGQEPAAQDTPELMDRIVAIVDEEAILLSDLEREVELYRMEQEYAGQTIRPSD